jgi:Uma2 family endonuclease
VAEAVRKTMTVEEFFDWQLGQDRNYELVDGVPVLPLKSMTGATDRHDRVTVNAIGSLFQQLRGKPCRPKTTDTSVRTVRGTRRPDVTVECGTPGDRSMAADEPRVVVEILSPSTRRYDQMQKLEEYKQHPLIGVILLVDTDLPRVTVWRRGPEGWSYGEVAGLDAVIPLPEIDAAISLADLYDGLQWPGPAE